MENFGQTEKAQDIVLNGSKLLVEALSEHLRYSAYCQSTTLNTLSRFYKMDVDKISLMHLMENQEWRKKGAIPGFGESCRALITEVILDHHLSKHLDSPIFQEIPVTLSREDVLEFRSEIPETDGKLGRVREGLAILSEKDERVFEAISYIVMRIKKTYKSIAD